VIRGPHAGRSRSGGFSLDVFTQDEIDDIHLATLEVLERTGVRIGGASARRLPISAWFAARPVAD
jgi:trimethylamine--corrinoid protein Co-methyltransferase